jgi:ParB-like chromosome segregation protein Spo0J
MQKFKISEIKLNPNNPRLIKDDKFEKLVKSIKDFPEMLDIRPIVVNSDMVILGGNMRFKACKEAGLKEIPVIVADNLTEEQQREFLIKDNTSGGEWDFEILANEWDVEELKEWGLDVPTFDLDVDYSILDDEDMEDQLEGMTNGVKKAIQIEFEAEHYDDAYALVKFWRDQGGYVGGMIMQYLKSEKEKI